jgi:type IX secretion system PorP/SprF family membrane protein
MKNIFYTILIAFVGTTISAQDAFFSNFTYSNALSNPSGIGISEDINLTLLHRTQWSSIIKPFATSQFEGSYPIRQANTNKKVAVIGLSFVNDRLGEGGLLSTNQFALTGAYLVGIGKSNLSIGAKLGYFNGSTNLTGIQTGSQFIGGTYNPSANIGENLANPVTNGLEITPSLTLFQNDSMGINRYAIGVSAFNVNQPTAGALVAGYNQMMRIAVTGSYTHHIGSIGIRPQALYLKQANQNQVVAGVDFHYYFQKSAQNYQAISLGGHYRLNDAGILSIKYLSRTIDGGLSYDVNTSGLGDPMNKIPGAFELFLNYRIKQESKIKQYPFTLKVMDKETKELIKANVIYLNAQGQSIDKMALENTSSGTFELNQKEEYQFEVTSNGYNSEKITVVHSTNEALIKEVYLEKTIKYFDLELEVLDKKTNQPTKVNLFVVDPATGKETALGSDQSFSTKLESGKPHKIIARAEGYDDATLDVNYDKTGTLSKTLFINQTLQASYLKLIVLDENTKKPLQVTAMCVGIEGQELGKSSLIVLNNFPPEKHPLIIVNKYEILISKEGYFNKTVKVDAVKIEDLELVVQLTPIEVGASIIVDDLLFKTGKTELDERSFRILDQLVDFMNQNPSIKIELQGHTDSDGADAANQKLSEGRAKSAVEYMVSKGIDKSRMTAKGYGESKPIESNATPEGKAKNRRVELKITGK